MAIDKLTPPRVTQGVSDAKKVKHVQDSKAINGVIKHDVVDVHAQNNRADKVAYSKAMNAIMNAPDVRAEKVEALMKNPSSYKFPSSETLQAVAKKLLKDFLG